MCLIIFIVFVWVFRVKGFEILIDIFNLLFFIYKEKGLFFFKLFIFGSMNEDFEYVGYLKE